MMTKIQGFLEKFKVKSPMFLVALAGIVAAVKYFFVNQTLGGYDVPSQAVDWLVGALGSLLAVHSTGSVGTKKLAASIGITLPVWLEAPLAKFLADFKVKNGRTWLWISVALMLVYGAVKYSLTTAWTLPKMVVDIVLTIVPFLLSSQTTGIIAIDAESANELETK